jgi:hypothetical protein
METIGHFEYFEVKGKYLPYKGKRFFKIGIHFDVCVQVVHHPGEMKRGKGHMIGISLISKITWYGNYRGPGYVESCTKEKYEEAFKEAVNLLS